MKIRAGIGVKLLIPVMIINMILCTVIGSVVYRQVDAKFTQEGGKEAAAVASLISMMVNGDDITALKDNLQDEEAFTSIHDTIVNAKKNSDVKYIYIIGEVDETYYYLVSDDDETASRNELEKEYYKEVSKTFNGAVYSTPYIDRSEYGSLITAYVPIYNSDNVLTGVLAVDYDAASIVESISAILKSIIFIGILMMIISFAIVFIVIKGMLRQIKQVDGKLKELVESNGDLTQKIAIQSNDEIGDIAKKINDLLEYIYVVIRNISNVTIQMKSSIALTRQSVGESVNELEEVAASTEELNAMIEETYSNIENISSVIDNMRELLSVVFRDIESGRNLAGDIRNRADVICQQAVNESENVKKVSDNLSISVADKIGKANDVEKIKDLTMKILGVAKKTSLLALNASIEAARAGEAGKGFSVVAEQISELSQDTASTATEIQEISNEIISVVGELSAEAGKMMDFVADKTAKSYELLLATGEEYLESSVKVADFFGNMQEQSIEMENGMAEIIEAVHTIQEASRECAAGVGQVNQLTSNLTKNLQENEQQAQKNEKMMEQLEVEVEKFVIE